MGEATAVARIQPAREVLPGSHRDNWEVVARQAEAWAKSTIIPEVYRGQPSNCLVALEMSHRTGIPVLAVMQNLHIIKGRPSWSAQFLIAAANACGRFSPLRYRFQGTEGQDDWGCRVVSKDLQSGEELPGALITVAMAKAEEWWSRKDKNGKETSKWQTMPEQMLRYRAAAFWARVYAPELAVGVLTREEIEDIPPVHDRAAAIAAVLDAADEEEPVVVGALPPGEPAKPAPDDGSPATAGQLKMLKEFRQKARDADLLGADDEEAIEGAIAAKNGPEVRRYINDIGKDLIVPGGAQTGLSV